MLILHSKHYDTANLACDRKNYIDFKTSQHHLSFTYKFWFEFMFQVWAFSYKIVLKILTAFVKRKLNQDLKRLQL